MNLKQAQMIVDIAVAIKGVKECSQICGASSSDLETPVCFFANGYRAGIISRKQAKVLEFPEGLAEKFHVSGESAVVVTIYLGKLTTQQPRSSLTLMDMRGYNCGRLI